MSTGVHQVLDTTVSRELSLIETAEDFLSRKVRREQGDSTALPLITGICPGITTPLTPNIHLSVRSKCGICPGITKPLTPNSHLSVRSECGMYLDGCLRIFYVIGWICYAEKSHGDYILPLISRVKSPQQIMGSLVKVSHQPEQKTCVRGAGVMSWPVVSLVFRFWNLP